MPSRHTSTIPHQWPKTAALLLCLLALGTAGCRRRTVQAAPPTIVTGPAAEPPAADKPESPSESKPDPSPSPAQPPAVNTPASKPAPSRPRPAPADTPPAPKAAPPQLSPGLSPEQQAVYESSTKEDIKQAEQNISASFGRTLNAAQHDLVEKIHDFLGQAREASKASDWVRARNLAQKARVLSVELVKSL